jgi:cytochrome c-type biogenesis protein CcmH/NrfG
MLWIDAQTRMALGDHDGAMASYRAALRDNPDDPTIQESLARARRLPATTQRSG